MEQNKFEVSTQLSKDTDKAVRIASDLTEFCKLMNRVFVNLVKGGYLGLNSITSEMVECAAQFNAEPIISAVCELYEQEAKRFKYERAKNDFLQGKESAIVEIKTAIESARQEYEKFAVKYYKPHDGGIWRLKYLTLTNGYVDFDRAMVMQDCTNTIMNDKQADFLNRAKELFEQIQSFNKECKRLSNGAVNGISYVAKGDAMITINELDELIFDASLSKVMDFS